MHDIRFVNPDGYKYLVEVDGVQIALSAAMNKIHKGDEEGLRAYIERLEAKIQSGDSLAELRPIMNGTNMLRVLEALFKEKTLENWKRVLAANPSQPGRASFEAYFGYIHNLKNCPSSFAEELYAIANEHYKAYRRQNRLQQQEAAMEKRIRDSKYDRAAEYAAKVCALELQNRTVAGNWHVERKHVVSNVVAYSVNGTEVEICLSGRPAFGYAFHVAAFITRTQDSLMRSDSDSLAALIRESGGKAAFEILGRLFRDQSLQFFVNEQRRRAFENREAPKPSSLMKAFLCGNSGTTHPFGQELLSALESDIPAIAESLVASSDDEIHSQKQRWKLFFWEHNRLAWTEIIFPEVLPLREEMQRFYVHVAEPYINSNKPYARQLYKINDAITSLLRFVDNSEASSVLELTVWDISSAVFKMEKQQGYRLSTIRKDLILTRNFISFLNPEAANKIIPAKLIPPPILNPTKPLDPSVFSQIKRYKDCLPEYVWLAFRVYEETGGRSTSILNLTVDCLVSIYGRWALRIYNFKEAEKNALSGVPNSMTHWLSDSLGNELNEYIVKTEVLRKQLPVPYIFVYEQPGRRANSKRRPMVLSSSAYNNAISSLCFEKGIVNREGIIQRPSARSIRAEVGRSMFASGKSADAVARKLNNTAPVAALHYDTMYPEDEAKKRRILYSETLDHKLGASNTSDATVIKLNIPMYGKCNKSEKCGNCNDCRNCSERITKRTTRGA